MKRFIAIGSAVVAAALIITAAVAATRPEWLPAGPARSACSGGGDRRGRGPLLQRARRPGEVLHDLPRRVDEDPVDLQGARRRPRGYLHPLPSRSEGQVQDPGVHRSTGCRSTSAPSAAMAPPPPSTSPTTAGAPPTTSPKPSAWSASSDSRLSTPTAEGAKLCRQPLPMVRLASAKLVRQVGVETAEVTEEEHSHKLEANAETAYDGNHYADVTPRVVGFIREVRADLGNAVKVGDVLAVVDSAEVSGAKAEYITARAEVELAQVDLRPDQVAGEIGLGRRQGRTRSLHRAEQGQGGRARRRAKAQEFRVRRGSTRPDHQGRGHQVVPGRGRPARRHGRRAARRQGRAGAVDDAAFRGGRHVEGLALDRRLRVRRRRGEAWPEGRLHRLRQR